MSEISSTDVDIFRRLGNPEVVDVNGAGNTTRQIAAQMRQAIETAVAARRGEEDDEEATPPPRRPESTAQGPPARAAAAAAAPPLASRLSQAMAAAASHSEETPPSRHAETAAPRVQPRAPPPRPPPEPSEAGSEEEEAPRSKDAEQLRLEKQGYLIELQALERKGVTLSRVFSMRDSVTELEFEVQKQQNGLSTANAVSFMRDSLKMAFNGIEIANSRLGPFLSIDGWAEGMTGDMKRFDNALERLYKRYWRKQQMSPLMELAWIILGSLAAHHFKQKLFGPSRPTPPPPPPPVPRQPPAARRGTPAQAPASAGLAARPKAAMAVEKARPVLRPPTALFG
jgi:hypothetical protein